MTGHPVFSWYFLENERFSRFNMASNPSTAVVTLSGLFLLTVIYAMFSLDVLSCIEPLWDVCLFVTDLEF